MGWDGVVGWVLPYMRLFCRNALDGRIDFCVCACFHNTTLRYITIPPRQTEKRGGCAHMHCVKCRTHWCWGCSQRMGNCRC
jgi:hypothetical protein